MRRPGPAPRLSREQLVDTAVRLVDEGGFEALSLRALARALQVTPMALYRYVESSDELSAMVIDRLVEAKARELELPADWRAALHTFATALAGLVGEHPALLQAYAHGAVGTPTGLAFAERLLTRLQDAGLPMAAIADAYAAVHTLALGHALVSQERPAATSPVDVDMSELPAMSALFAAGHRLGSGSLVAAVDLVITGLEQQLPTA